ncbi:MAG: DUF3575 domain-containing protein [Rikenellaceae bacterium]|jgi:hypothetical protein|nr:DUF3575 domain-containing protein [Rikenellaceae bacterium]
MKRLLVLIVPLLLLGSRLGAQDLAVKTNLLYWGTLTPNLGFEVGLSPKSTFLLWGGYNSWNLSGSETNNKKLVHWIIMPEYRYWFCERFNGHFIGVHLLGSKYNVSQHNVPLLFEKAYRYEGWGVGGGVAYGYHYMLSKRWGLEGSIGIGGIYMGYTKYNCPRCGSMIGDFTRFYFGPTTASISLVYLIK